MRDGAVVDAVVVGAVGFAVAELVDVDDAEFFEVGDGAFEGGDAPAGQLGLPLCEGVVDPALALMGDAVLLLDQVVQLLEERGFDDAKRAGE